METRALLAAAEELRRAGDGTRADQLEQLEEKRRSGLFYIAFCGHFSAGKSTMINRLCGYPLLPSSPIPTSANIVQIRSGVPGAQLLRRSDGGEKRTETIGLEELAQAARNGETVESVAISYPIPFLGEKTVLLDTPGIDSTDDAHRMSTESALH
jgi:ribosome biogenesis GTPase A